MFVFEGVLGNWRLLQVSVWEEGEGTLIAHGWVGPEFREYLARSGQAVETGQATRVGQAAQAGQPGSAATWVAVKLRLLLSQ